MSETTFLLIRHGIAQDPGPRIPDAERALTPEGWERTRAAMRGLVARGYRPSAVWTSPFRRARETMACLREVCGSIPAAEAEWLLHGAAPAEAEMHLRALAEEHPGAVLALVSHQPLVSELVDLLTGVAVEGRKASCTVLTFEEGRFRCREYLPPSLLRELA